MTNEHALTLTLGNADDLAWAQATVTTHHYLRKGEYQEVGA